MPDKGKLAIHGGEPVRKVPIPPAYPGACVYGEEEKKAVVEVIENKSPIYMLPQIFNKKTVDNSKFPFDQFGEEIVYTKDMCPAAWDIMPRSAMISLSPAFTGQDVDDIVKAIHKVAKYLL